MLIADQWKDYELLDTGYGEKLERWGRIVLRRPDPQVIWPRHLEEKEWNKADAHYLRSKTGGHYWEHNGKLPTDWTIQYKNLTFHIRPTDFKHTGLFPEQAVNWDWLTGKVRGASGPVRVLNLFAYTGGATVALAAAGAEVCHVDAAKGMVTWARQNAAVSGLADRPVRWIVDDVFKFVEREKRRGRTYDGIIMDPPSYGRGPRGEVWKVEEKLYEFTDACMDLLSDRPLFFLINSYASKFAPSVLANILKATVDRRSKGQVSCGEIGLPVSSSGLVLPCGIYGRWEAR